MHQLILQLIEQRQVTIFLITHDLSEAEKLCSRVAVMHGGRIRVVGQPGELRRQLQPHLNYALRVDQLPPAGRQKLVQLVPDLREEQFGNHRRLYFQAAEEGGLLMRILDLLRQEQVTIYGIEGHPPTLEEVFAHYTEEDER